MTAVLDGQVPMFVPDTWSGKTSPEPSVQREEKTSEQSSKKRRGSRKKGLQFLDLRTENGRPQDALWETVGALPGEYWTLNIGEYPSVAEESHLWQILQDDPPERYFLSAKACLGILRRAERRGKKLPELLEMALREQVGTNEACSG